MGEIVKGVVQEIKAVPTRTGKTMYNLVVTGEAFSVGLYAPKVKVGDYVQFEVEMNGQYKNVARGSLQISKDKPPVEAVKAASTYKPVDQEKKQDIISRQASTNTAIEYLKLAQDAGVLGLSASAKKGAALESLDIILKKYTKLFYEQNTGTAWTDIGPEGQKDEVSVDQDIVVTDEPWE